MTIRHLKIYIAVAETGSMSAAAAKLFISQPTVSQAIRELEEHYNLRFFERLSKRLYITEHGKEMLSYARQTVGQFDQMESQMTKSGGKELLKVGATITVGTCLLANLLNDLQKLDSNVDTYAYVGNTSQIEEKLLHSELDVGIVEGTVESPDLVSIPIIDDFLVLACSMEHPFAKCSALHHTDLEGERFVMREKGSGTRALFEAFLQRHGVRINTAWEANCPESIRSAILDRSCLAVLSIRLLERDIKEGRIRVICSDSQEWERKFSLVYHKDKIITPQIETLKGVMFQYQRPSIQEKFGFGRLVTD